MSTRIRQAPARIDGATSAADRPNTRQSYQIGAGIAGRWRAGIMGIALVRRRQECRTEPSRVLHVGLGPISTTVVRNKITTKKAYHRGTADIDPGQGWTEPSARWPAVRTDALRVGMGDVRKAIKAAKPDVVVLCTRFVR